MRTTDFARRTCLGMIASLGALADADVLYRSFEPSGDSLKWAYTSVQLGSRTSLQLDTTSPLAGRGSAKFGFVLTQNPYANFTFSSDTNWTRYDLRTARGLHVRIKSDVETVLWLFPITNWYSMQLNLEGYTVGWELSLRPGVLDTVLPFSDIGLRAWYASQALAASMPSNATLLQGVSGFSFHVYPATASTPDWTSTDTLSGTLEIDSVTITGLNALPPGSDPKRLTLWEAEDTAFSRLHADSVPGTFRYSNPASSMKVGIVSADTGLGWGKVAPLFTYHAVPEPGKEYSSWTGCGWTATALDVSGTSWFEFPEHVSNTGNYRINLLSDRYAQSSIDSGIIYGWDVDLASVGWMLAVNLKVSDLAPPSWASSRTQALALLPGVAEALKGVNGFQIQPNFKWTDAHTLSSPSTGTILFDDFVAFGIDRAVPSTRRPAEVAGGRASTHRAPWNLAGSTLTNSGFESLAIFDLEGRPFAEAPPAGQVRLRKGLWICRSGKESGRLVVP